jgi:hypothetical protein
MKKYSKKNLKRNTLHNKKHTQRKYHMIGCNKKRACIKGGDPYLAYTGAKQNFTTNPFFSYVGKGGNSHIATNYQAGRAYKSRGSCGCGVPFFKGFKGGCGCDLAQSGGVKKGGFYKYPDGLVGSPYTPTNLPGSSIPGSSNYYALNMYHQDPQTSGIILERATPIQLKGGRRTRRRKGGDGTVLPQDLVNFGRSISYGMGSVYNTLSGYSPPVNPLPFKDQLIGKV